MKRFLHIVLVLLVAVACRGPRVIPKDTLTDIYTDMFLADQMVRDADIPRAQMDTMLLYEAVFEKYGYDTEDYLYSLRYYLKDPERFGKVFENVAKRLEGEVDALDKIIYKDAYDALDATVQAAYVEKQNTMPTLSNNKATASTATLRLRVCHSALAHSSRAYTASGTMAHQCHTSASSTISAEAMTKSAGSVCTSFKLPG